MKFWIGVVSKEHALLGIAGGFMQACHGKAAPLKRMKQGDGVLFYCPKELFIGKEKCQKFLGLGRVKTGEVYQFSMSEDFHPFRLDIQYIQDAAKIETSILPLIHSLSFINDKKHWGAPFRFGHLQIPEQDFLCITAAMGLDFKQSFPAETGKLAVGKHAREDDSSFPFFNKEKSMLKLPQHRLSQTKALLKKLK